MAYREAGSEMNGADSDKRPIMGYSGNLTIRPGDLIAELFESGGDAVDEQPTPLPVIGKRSVG